MKKIFLALVMMFAITSCKADEAKSISYKDLLGPSKTFIETYFKDKVVDRVYVENIINKDYNVFFKDGTKIEFNRRGEWDEVENRLGIPTGFILAPIVDYIKQNYPDNTIVKIAKDDRKYDVELNNGFDLEFDLKGNFLRID